MPLLVYMLLLFFAIIFLWLRKKKSHYILKTKVWLIISYSFLIIIHFFSGIVYKVASIPRILPYFILCLLLIIIGDSLSRTIKLKSLKSPFKIKLSTLSYLSIFGSLLYVYDILSSNEVFFGLRIIELKTSIVGVLGNVLASLGLIVWLTSFYNNRIENTRIPLYSYLSILAYIAGGLVSAGRQAIIILSISSLIMFVWTSYRIKEIKLVKNRKAPIGMIVFLFLFASYFLFISAFRTKIFDIDNKMNMFEREFNASISEKNKVQIRNINPLSDIYVESIFYYSHQLRRLDLTFEHYDYVPLFGLGQLSYVERRLQWLIGKQRDISWKKMDEAIQFKGNFGLHSWGTFIVNYIVDFGRFGALIACFLTGIVYGRSYSRLSRHVNKENVTHHIILLSGVVFSIQFSPLIELIWFFPLLFSSLIKIETNSISSLKKSQLLLKT